jgi:hypothetical protein
MSSLKTIVTIVLELPGDLDDDTVRFHVDDIFEGNLHSQEVVNIVSIEKINE